MAGQSHADEQSDGGRRRWKKGIHRSQTLHVQHEGSHPHGQEDVHVHLSGHQGVLARQERRSLRPKGDDEEERRHHTQMKGEQTPRQRAMCGVMVAPFGLFVGPVKRAQHQQHASSRQCGRPSGFHAVLPREGQRPDGPSDDQTLRLTMVASRPHQKRVSKKQGAHPGEHPRRRHAVRTGGCDKGHASEDEAEVPQVQQFRISEPRAHFRKPGKPTCQVQTGLAHSQVHDDLLADQRQHPNSQVGLVEHDGNKVGVHQALFEIGGEDQQPRIGCKNRHAGHAWRGTQHGDKTQPQPNGALGNEQQSRIVAAVIGGNEQREQHDDDQGPHPQDMVRNVGLMGQQDAHAQGGGGRSKDRIFTQIKREGQVHNTRIEQGQRCDKKRHRCEHKGHQSGPFNAAHHQIGRGEGQGEQHQLSQRIPRFCSVRCNGHQGAHHPQGNGDGPQAGFAQADGVNRLTEPVFMVDEGGGHGCIGGGHHAKQEEERQVVFNGKQGQ